MSCKHPALFKTMCVTCGAIIKTDDVSAPKSVSALTMHGGAALHVTTQEAEAIQANKLSKLRDLKKIALVLDLDHTLLHAVQIDGPFAGSNQREFPDEVHHLPIEEVVNNTVKHLVMKKRPHLDWFLREANEICQMTIYTAGTRRYAEAVAKIIDPDHKYFSNRIVSRSDSANTKLETHDKSLERIFLKDSSMAVIIDDREDVWRANNDLSQLLLVRPYIYFTPLNLNSSVIEANNSSGPVSSSAMLSNGGNNLRAVAPVIALSGKPGKIVKTVQQFSSEFSESDDQLVRCLEVVRELHGKYYSTGSGGAAVVSEESDRSSSSSASTTARGSTAAKSAVGGENNGQLSSSASRNSLNGASGSGYENIGSILTTLKSSILSGCTITFSGIIPTNEPNPQNHILYKLAESLGAQVSLDLLPRTTHLISLNVSTSKAIECVQTRSHNVWILHPDWLIYCRWALARVLEVTFMLNALPPGAPFPTVELNFVPLTPTTSRRPTDKKELQPQQRVSNGSISDFKPFAMPTPVAAAATNDQSVDSNDGTISSSNSGDGNAKRKLSSDPIPLVVTDPRLAKRQRASQDSLASSTGTTSTNDSIVSTTVSATAPTTGSSAASSSTSSGLLGRRNGSIVIDDDYDFAIEEREHAFYDEDNELEADDELEEEFNSDEQFVFHTIPSAAGPPGVVNPVAVVGGGVRQPGALMLPSQTEGWVSSDVDEEVGVAEGDSESDGDSDDYSEFESIVLQTASAAGGALPSDSD